MRPTRLWANLSTSANGLLGVGAIAYALAGNKLWAMLLIVAGLGFDGLDGWLHRRSGLPSDRFGRIADSVADAITFGLAPAALVALHPERVALWRPWGVELWVAAGLIAALAIARLVWFTLHGFHDPYFVGAPTPQNAIALIAVLLLFDVPAFLGTQPVLVIVASIGLAVTMVLPIRFPKIRRGGALRVPMTVTAVALVLALLPLQFAPSPGSVLFDLAFGATIVVLAGVLGYYLVGPWTLRTSAVADRVALP